MANDTQNGTRDAFTTMEATNISMSAWELLQSLDFMAVEIQMILSAVIIIYVGAHAALRRPPSAAAPATTHKSKRTNDGKPVKDDSEQFAPGFEASDAIYFPVFAGMTLVGLYYLIQWLQDPAILNTILRWYMSITGVVGLGNLLGNTMQVTLGFVFPERWLDSKGNTWRIDSRRRVQVLDGPDANLGKTNPFPGAASKIPVSPHSAKALFTIRKLLMEDWQLRVKIFGLCDETVPYKLTSLIGYLLGAVLQGAYLYFGGNALSNMVGLSLSYTALTLISVTSFPIGSCVLCGLFVYDIIMVFYTPFMIAVATQIDAPIKLSYKTATRSSMLGLGDIVLPGIFISLALRFDLWMHYRRQIKQEETALETTSKVDVPAEGTEPATAKEVTTVTMATRDVKAPFVDPRGQWGNYFWTTTWRKVMVGGKSSSKTISERAFPKPYFHATIVGYFIGMCTTIGILITFKHGQPALLYLVPGVLCSVYWTGFRRGELKEMFIYTEDGTLDTKEVVVDLDADGKPVAADAEVSKNELGRADTKDGSSEEMNELKVKETISEEGDQQKDYEVFSFSIVVPKEEHGTKED